MDPFPPRLGHVVVAALGEDSPRLCWTADVKVALYFAVNGGRLSATCSCQGNEKCSSPSTM